MNLSRSPKQVLVGGASSGIGLSITAQYLQQGHQVYGTVRATSKLSKLKDLQQLFPGQLHLIEINLDDEASFQKAQDTLGKITPKLDVIFNCIGLLHDETKGIFPERKLSEFNAEDSIEVFKANTLSTLMLAKYFSSHLKESESPLFAAVSAKVGSIEDNKTGGWHSYRISKAALNMAIKNISIELKRLNQNIVVVALHPGTTESKLSEPFLGSARKKYQIHSADQTAQNLLKVVETLSSEDNGTFYSWDGQPLPW